MNLFRFAFPNSKVKAAFYVVFIALVLAGCSGLGKKSEKTGRVTHIVLCWLKEAGNGAHRQKLIETSLNLRSIPGVIDVRAGEAVASDRPIVDDSFDVGITFTFADTGAMNAYLEHPLHREAQQKVLQPLVRKIVVYDVRE